MKRSDHDGFRLSLGVSIGDTVPMWGSRPVGPYRRTRRSRWFYAWANRPSEHSFGGVGFKAGFVFVRLVYGPRA
jgi:hypothetical protein